MSMWEITDWNICHRVTWDGKSEDLWLVHSRMLHLLCLFPLLIIQSTLIHQSRLNLAIILLWSRERNKSSALVLYPTEHYFLAAPKEYTPFNPLSQWSLTSSVEKAANSLKWILNSTRLFWSTWMNLLSGIKYLYIMHVKYPINWEETVTVITVKIKCVLIY